VKKKILNEIKTAYQYVLDICEKIEETCQLAQEEVAKVQKRNQIYYNRRGRKRKLNVGDKVLLLLPTENNKLTLAWRGPYEVVETVGEVDCRIRVTPDKVKSYHIDMLKMICNDFLVVKVNCPSYVFNISKSI